MKTKQYHYKKYTIINATMPRAVETVCRTHILKRF